MISSVSDRVLGQYPVSVATSLALEAACGIHPDYPVTTAPILRYKELWINIRTLHRNFVGSLPKDSALVSNPKAIAEYIKDEIDVINGVIMDATNNKVKVVYYFSNYKNLDHVFKKAVFRMDNTVIQKANTTLMNDVMLLLLKSEIPIIGFDNKLSQSIKTKTLIMTHYPIDLLWWENFESLSLLESHTGRIKHRSEWYEKYYNGKKLPPMPFRIDLIQVFGDKETILPMDLKLRNEVIEIAKKYNWTAITTSDRIIFSYSQIKNPYARDILRSINTR